MLGKTPEDLENRLELISQDPITPDLRRDLQKLRQTRARIAVMRPGALFRLNEDTRGIILFDSRHTPEDYLSVFLPSPSKFKRNKWRFEDEHGKVLCETYLKYFIHLRKVLKERPGDWLTIGSGSTRISTNSQLAIISASASDSFWFEIRKKGPDFKLFVDTPEERDLAIEVAPLGLGIEIRQKGTSELWTNISQPCNQCPLR